MCYKELYSKFYNPDLQQGKSGIAVYNRGLLLSLLYTVKPRFTAEFGGKEISAVNRGSR